MCICWCVTEIKYKMHGATIKIIIGILFLSAFCHLRLYFMQSAQYLVSNVCHMHVCSA